jgi:hypothetical protein
MMEAKRPQHSGNVGVEIVLPDSVGAGCSATEKEEKARNEKAGNSIPACRCF